MHDSGATGRTIARVEGRHRAIGGNALRAAVLGANDGLVSNFSLVMGVAGAGADQTAILVAGFAGLLAGAALFGVGAAITRITGRSPVRSGLRQLAFGLAAAAITYGIGTLVGTALA